jgi:hypothetical protein
MPQMYCLNCLYDLRGLTEFRCPECGRGFSPVNLASFSTTPRRERFQKLVKQASDLLSDALNSLEPVDPITRAVLPLRRQIARLAVENAELRQQLAAITQLLLDKNVIDEPSWLAALGNAERAADMQVIDDTVEATVSDVEAPATPELLALRKAVEDVGS